MLLLELYLTHATISSSLVEGDCDLNWVEWRDVYFGVDGALIKLREVEGCLFLSGWGFKHAEWSGGHLVWVDVHANLVQHPPLQILDTTDVLVVFPVEYTCKTYFIT